MVHASTHLAFCWHFDQILDSSSPPNPKPNPAPESRLGDEIPLHGAKQNRRQRFRDRGGPSRESLQRSHIVSILRRIPVSDRLAGRSDVDDGRVCGDGEELPADVMWPLRAVSEIAEGEVLRVDWEGVPESADPLRGFGYKRRESTKRASRRCGGGHEEEYGDGEGEGEEGKLVRGARKRSQVESIATALQLLDLPAGSVVVDFGSGSGALSLPLACLFKEFTFVCVDYKQESLRLLDLRAQAAKLNNLTTWQGRIEDYSAPFDACVALHACGHATDLALLQALRRQAGYVVSPCCVGKLQFAVSSPSFTKTIPRNNNYTPENLRTAIATENGYVFPNLRGTPVPPLNNNPGTHHEMFENIAKGIHRGVHPLESESLLTYPRSQWLRTVVTRDDFLLLARTADWSSYDYDSWTSRLHSLCKVVVELDRNQASQEAGYRGWLLSLADQKAGAVGVSHILVGKPPR